jgi:mannose-6-phosphate isomerase-like protein (cupin superfamily)
LTNREAASVRVFRVYRPTPPHYHTGCDEILFVLSGRGLFWMGSSSEQREIGPGQLVVFPKGVVHAMAGVLEEPFTFLSVDTPRRDPRDIVFVDPSQGSPESFIERSAAG